MKKTIITILQLQLITPTLLAAVPLRWTVETSRVQPAVFEAYQGETLTFEAALQSYSKPIAAPLNYSFYWQTNGMGSTYWEAPAQRGSGVSPLVGGTNVLFATFTPSMDVGAKVYNCFIGAPSNNYRAAFQLRLRPSPGALPNALPLPTPVIDFSRVRVLNPPWPNSDDVRQIAGSVVGPVADAANNAETNAQMAISRAANAQSTADQAVTDAANAQATADQAATAAANAQATADQAATDAANAQATANQAGDDAQAAISLASGMIPSQSPRNESAEWEYDEYTGEWGLTVESSESGSTKVFMSPTDISIVYNSERSSYRISLNSLSSEMSYISSDYHYLSDEIYRHKANLDDSYNYNPNPHGVTAHDVGSPTVEEVKEMISSITPLAIGAATQSDIDSAINGDDPHFKSQVLAAGLNIDPQAAEEINDIIKRGSFESNCAVVVRKVIDGDREVRRLIVDSAKLYWDPGLQVTWQIDVTNGMFYSHIVSDQNLVNRIP